MTDWLTDSNVWLRIAEPEHQMFEAAEAAVEKVLSDGDEIHLVPQVVTEYWRVGTGLAGHRAGLGWDTARAQKEITRLESLFPLEPDTAAVYEKWKEIVIGEAVSSSSVYDARLVAAMLAHGLTHILTFNVKDFRRYERWGITVVDPKDV